MIPLDDSVASQRRPVATYALIGACALVFAYELSLRGAALEQFVDHWGAQPRLVLAALAGDPRVPRAELLTLLTSQFIHAGFLHLGGNMLFLWVFGRAVEDRLGPLVYLAFYLVAGVAAGLVQCLVGPAEQVPLVGASGAIAGVLGLYFVSYPTAWVRVLTPVLFLFWTFDLPAVLVLAFWFVGQFFNGLAAITTASRATTGDVAVWAHLAGFVVGAASGLLLPGVSAAARTRPGPMAPRRADAPGPARLVSSLADLAALLLGARVVLRLFGLLAPRSPLAAIGVPIVAVTDPLVAPLEPLAPAVRLAGGVLETAAVLAIILVYVVAGLLGQVFLRA